VSYLITVEEAMRGVFAAWFMFLRDKRAASLLSNDYVTAVKSYWAALLILPLYLVVTTIELTFGTGSGDIRNFGVMVEQAGFARAAIAEVCVYVLCWFVAWPLVLDKLAPYLDCDDNFFRYVAAYNWMRVIYVMVGVFYIAALAAGAIPAESRDAAGFALLVVLLTYHWFVLRHALGANGGYSALLVAAEFLLVTMIKDVVLNLAL
jgi:hypothetical protein